MWSQMCDDRIFDDNVGQVCHYTETMAPDNDIIPPCSLLNTIQTIGSHLSDLWKLTKLSGMVMCRDKQFVDMEGAHTGQHCYDNDVPAPVLTQTGQWIPRCVTMVMTLDHYKWSLIIAMIIIDLSRRINAAFLSGVFQLRVIHQLSVCLMIEPTLIPANLQLYCLRPFLVHI